MTAIPQPEHTTVAAMFAAIVARTETEPRPHLGASVLGRPCARALWYHFRWCEPPITDGRLLRLFRRGQLEEEQIAEDLRAAGVQVVTHDEHGRQYRFADIGGHVGGSMDAALLGLLEAPKTWHVGEWKTHGAKSFRELAAKGVQAAKPEHWAQVQLYMHWSGMQRAYYLAVCKDTDDIYAERVRYDMAAAVKLLARAGQIVRAAEPLPRIDERPEYYLCRFCSVRPTCHEGRLPPPTCRTCVHATPELDGAARWSCARHGVDLDVAAQRAGCEDHVYIPALAPWQQTDADPDANCVTYANGYRNGTPDADTYASAELYAAQDTGFALLNDPTFTEIRARTNGRITETDPA